MIDDEDLVWCEEPICTWVANRDALATRDGVARCPVCGSAWVGHVGAEGDWVSPPRPTDPSLRYDGYTPEDDEFEGDLEDDPPASALDGVLDRAMAGRLDVTRRVCGPDEITNPFPCPDERVDEVGIPAARPGPASYFPRPKGTEAAWEVAELPGPPMSSYTVHRDAPDLWRFSGVFTGPETTSAAVAVANRWAHGRPLDRDVLTTAAGIARAVRAVLASRILWYSDPGDATWH